MKVIKLSAYLNGNLGDDLMVEILMQRYPNVYFWDSIPCQVKPECFYKYKFFNNEDIYIKFGRINHLMNILTLYRHRDFFYRFIFRMIKNNCVCGVSIGGSIFKQYTSGKINDRILLEENKKVNNKPFYIIGANFGPYQDKEFFTSFHEFFKKCNGITFRDSKSYELFSDISHVQWYPDVVFNIEEGKTINSQKVLISVIDFSIRPLLQQYEEIYTNKIIEICKYVINCKQIPVLVSFCENEGDYSMVKKIRSKLNKCAIYGVEEYNYTGNTQQTVQLFREASFIIATRFHSMILGLRFYKPMFVISYEIKIDNVLNDYGNVAYCLIQKLEDFPVKKMFNMGKQTNVNKNYISQSINQFQQLDSFLNPTKQK